MAVLIPYLEKLGMKQSALDACCFYWHDGEKLSGVIAFHVDDLVMGGSVHFHELVLSKLRDRFPFKHWKTGKAKFLGRMLHQLADYSIVRDQEEYASQVRSVHISRERRKERHDMLTKQELTQFRGVLGAANWLVSSTRPDLAAQNASLQRSFSRATVADLIEANKLFSVIRDHASMRVTYRSIAMSDAVLLLATDASWPNAQDLRSQGGHMILFAERAWSRSNGQGSLPCAGGRSSWSDTRSQGWVLS